MRNPASDKLVQDPITGSIKQPVPRVILSAPIFFCVLVLAAIFMPFYREHLVMVASILGIAGTITSIWLNAKPSLILKFLNFASIAGLSGIVAIRAFEHLWPSGALLMAVLIILTVVAAHLLPIVNSNMTWFLRGELSHAPKTRIGRFLLKASLVIFPACGFIGAVIGLFLNARHGGIDIAAVIVGPLFWLLAILLPFSTAFPSSPWEPKQIPK
jgi:hypothetical protein